MNNLEKSIGKDRLDIGQISLNPNRYLTDTFIDIYWLFIGLYSLIIGNYWLSLSKSCHMSYQLNIG